MTKLADELEALAKAIRAAIEYMPYLDRQKEDDDGDYLPLTLREFYEETWQGSYADELFQDVENVIITALSQPVADEAQRLQDHMEQHHGVCLQASQWDAAITALRQPDAVPEDPLGDGSDYGVTPLVEDEWPGAVPGDLVGRLQLHKSWRDSHGELNDAPNEAAAAIQSLTAERDAMRLQGQSEGFAAAVAWLRDRGAMKPRPMFSLAAETLADQMEQSRIPGQARALLEGSKP